MLIKNGRVIDPSRNFDEVVDILIDGDTIKKIGRIEKADGHEVIDASGYVVAPGLIDVHVHFREPGQTHKEDIMTGSKSAAAGGFTTVIAMANTNPIIDNAETLKYVLEKNKEAIIKVKNVAALTIGFKGEELVDMEKLHEMGVVAFSDDGIPLKHEATALEGMKRAKELDTVISFHEESPSFVHTAGVNDGKVSEKLGLRGSMAIAEEVMIARDMMLASYTGAKIDIQHISSGKSVDLVRYAKSIGVNIYAEATPHHFSLTEDIVLEKGTLAKMNPPLREENDRLKIIEGLKDGTIDMVATDHAPHSDEEKNVEFPKAPSGIIGLETSLCLGITNLVNENHMTLSHLIKLMSTNPAKIFKLDGGSIEVGGVADIVIFDENQEQVIGKTFSKSNNSPFIDKKLKGKVKYTICDGKIVYKDV